MKKINSIEALKLIFIGEILEAGERYYKYNNETNEIYYSDDEKNWKVSVITINDFLKWDNWNVIK